MNVTNLHARPLAIASLTAMLLVLVGCERSPGPGEEPPAVGGPAMLRRITEAEYRATIADIFGADIPVAARFDRDLRSEGLIAIGTGQSGMSAFSIEQYDAAAASVASTVTSAEHRERLLPCTPADAAGPDDNCAGQVVDAYGPLLFRRPLRAGERAHYVEAAHEGAARLSDFHTGLRFALMGMLVAPDFLFRIERAAGDVANDRVQSLDAYSHAARLSYFLSGAAPDRELLRAAGAGELETAGGLEQQVDRLMQKPSLERAVRLFFEDMLEFDRFDELAKDPQIYPAFNSEVASDAREQTLRTIGHHLITLDGDYRELFTTRHTFLTRALGVVYRLPVAARKGWQEVDLPADSQRDGIQSQISFLALHSHPGRSSPTLRGQAIREVFLCADVPDPPPNTNFSVVQDTGNSALPTARDRLRAHREEPSCAGCHAIMDPLGLTLENFDGAGGFRATENAVPIDASGDLDGTIFDTPQGLARALRDHPETPRCVAEKLYRFAVGRDLVWEERPYMDYLVKSFAASGYRLPALMRTIATSNNFHALAPGDERLAGATNGDQP